MREKPERKKIKKGTRLGPGDFLLLVLTFILVAFGVIMVFSASYYSSISKDGNPYYYLIRDIIWVISGSVIMVATMVIDYRVYKKFAPYLMVISLILLALIKPFGIEVNGAKRWLGFGPVTIMPGEIAKICVIIFVAWFLSVKPERIRQLTKGILPLLGLAALYGLLVMMQPNMSTAVTIVAIIIIMMFVAGMNYRYLFGILGLGIVGGLAIIFVGGGYRLNRATSFTDPFSDSLGNGYQVAQSLLALGSGGLFGMGLGKSVQKTLYLPEPQNDFILAIIGEELGYIGIIVLMLVYILMIWRCIKVSLDAPDRFGMLLGTGITTMIAIQVVMNIAVVTSSMPATGVTLPFVSYGGNALWMFMGAMGILINISRHTAALKASQTKDGTGNERMPRTEIYRRRNTQE